MPLAVTDLETLIEYFTRVMNRTHHAPNVDAIALALLGAVLWKKDDGAPIEVRTYDGRTANILWVQIAGRRYALGYNHREQCIELRDRDDAAAAPIRFTNRTTVVQVRRIFEELKPTED